AHMCGFQNLGDCGLALAERIPQRFESHFQADLVAVLEAISDSLRNRKDQNWNSFNNMGGATKCQRRSREPRNAHRRAVFPWATVFLADRDPYFERVLGCDLVKAECGQ